MKTIGLIGGTGWISSVEYYRIINQEVNRRMGGLQFAKCILYSVNYGEVDALNKKNDSAGVLALMSNAMVRTIDAGAECILMCANTSHQFADELEQQIKVPLIHIARVTANEINARGYTKVGLLGSKQTMEMDFYRNILLEHKVKVIIPDENDRNFIQHTLDHEFLKGLFLQKTKEGFIAIIDSMRQHGAEAIVLGCTEIPLLIEQGDTDLPVINTLDIHAKAAVDFAIS